MCINTVRTVSAAGTANKHQRRCSDCHQQHYETSPAVEKLISTFHSSTTMARLFSMQHYLRRLAFESVIDVGACLL